MHALELGEPHSCFWTRASPFGRVRHLHTTDDQKL